VIYVTRLDGRQLVINAELIESIEATPDTIISTTTGTKLMVREPVSEIVARVIEYKRKCNARFGVHSGSD
jgi:flagellar protein FlbD